MRAIGTFAGLMLLAACSSAPPEKPADPVALVSTARVVQGSIAESVTLYGAVESGAAARTGLVAPIEAIVVAIDAPVGTAVSRGQVIVRLAPSPIARLDLTRADSEARLASAALGRAARLRADGLVSDSEVETARAAARSALATRASLTLRGGALVLRATNAGYVDTVAPGVGDLVPAGTIVATVARTGDLRARFGIDPALARRLSGSARLRIVPSGGGSQFSAPVQSVVPVVDPITRLASVYTLVPSIAGIGAGEALTAEVQISEAAAALTIPYAALLDEGGQPFVFVVERSVAHRRDVTTGPASGDQVAILKGVSSGELIVISGGTALEDGMKVRTR